MRNRMADMIDRKRVRNQNLIKDWLSESKLTMAQLHYAVKDYKLRYAEQYGQSYQDRYTYMVGKGWGKDLMAESVGDYGLWAFKETKDLRGKLAEVSGWLEMHDEKIVILEERISDEERLITQRRSQSLSLYLEDDGDFIERLRSASGHDEVESYCAALALEQNLPELFQEQALSLYENMVRSGQLQARLERLQKSEKRSSLLARQVELKDRLGRFVHDQDFDDFAKEAASYTEKREVKREEDLRSEYGIYLKDEAGRLFEGLTPQEQQPYKEMAWANHQDNPLVVSGGKDSVTVEILASIAWEKEGNLEGKVRSFEQYVQEADEREALEKHMKFLEEEGIDRLTPLLDKFDVYRKQENQYAFEEERFVSCSTEIQMEQDNLEAIDRHTMSLTGVIGRLVTTVHGKTVELTPENFNIEIDAIRTDIANGVLAGKKIGPMKSKARKAAEEQLPWLQTKLGFIEEDKEKKTQAFAQIDNIKHTREERRVSVSSHKEAREKNKTHLANARLEIKKIAAGMSKENIKKHKIEETRLDYALGREFRNRHAMKMGYSY
jgi:hypothetical protein